MPFFIFTAIITGLQYFHRKFLLQVLPGRMSRWILPFLVGVHLPLATYMGMRLLGLSSMGLASPWLRGLSRVGLYFQMLTVLNLFFWVLAQGAWRLGHLWRKGAAGPPEDPGRRTFLRQTSAAGAGIALLGGVAGAVEARSDPEILRHTLRFPSLPPGLDGLRLVQLTDLHAGPLMKQGQMLRWRRFAEAERPEVLLITGDLVDSLPEEISDFVTSFKDFRAPLGVFAVLGNHDYFTDPQPIWKALEGMGITLLENRNALVKRNGDLLALVGLQDEMARHGHFREVRFGPGPSPEMAVQGIPDAAWRLCLCHRPSDWPLARRTGSRLTLAGHTHGGQVNLIPGLSSALIIGPYTQGLYTQGQDHLYVSRGLGVVGLPVRIGAPPEITVITLRRG